MRRSTNYVFLLCLTGAGCGGSQPKTEAQEQEAWLDAKQPARVGDVEVRVTGVRFGQPRVRGLKAGERAPAGKMVIVYLGIKNLSETKKISHLSWARTNGAFQPRLSDDQGAGATNHAFIYCAEVDDVKTADGPIPPGKTGRDLVAFELPIAKASTLKLSLPGMQIGQKGHVRFTIPVTMIERK